MRLRVIFVIPVVIGVVISVFATARAFQQDNETYALVQIVDDLNQPLYITHAGDERLFVVEKGGRIRLIKDGRLVAQPFLDITSIATSENYETGLLGLAFDPDYASNGRFYVNYTDRDQFTRVERYQVSDDPDLADAGSAELVLTFKQPHPNHNGGHLAFGPDGYLYIGVGDGGSSGDPDSNGQNLETWLGSLLRIDVSGEPPYEVPSDNPFVDDAKALPEIWAYGLRNPWRFSFDPQTGDLFIADVGQGDTEEINLQAADSPGGENYGWRFYEGNSNFRGASGDREPFAFPIFEYSHNLGCSVTGGYVYRGEAISDLQGKYIFGDFCEGTIWSLNQQDGGWQSEIIAERDFQIASFGTDVDGEVYIAAIWPGEIWKLQAIAQE